MSLLYLQGEEETIAGSGTKRNITLSLYSLHICRFHVSHSLRVLFSLVCNYHVTHLEQTEVRQSSVKFCLQLINRWTQRDGYCFMHILNLDLTFYIHFRRKLYQNSGSRSQKTLTGHIFLVPRTNTGTLPVNLFPFKMFETNLCLNYIVFVSVFFSLTQFQRH